MVAKPIKFLAIAAGVLIALVLVATLLLSLLVDEEWLKTTLADTVHKQTGATLRIDGELGWTLWPRLGVKTTAISLVPPDTDTQLFTAEEMTVALQMRPLLNREVKNEGVRLAGLVLQAEIDASGRASWAGMTGTSDAEAAEPPPASGADLAAVAAAPLALDVGRLEIDDARIEYNNRQTGDFLRLDQLQLDASNMNTTGGNFPLTLSVLLQQAVDAEPIRIEMESELAADLAANTVRLTGLTLQLAAPGLPTLRLETDASIDIAASTAQLPAWKVSATGLQGSGALDANWSGEQATFQVPLDFQQIDIPRLLAETGNEVPENLNRQALETVGFKADISGKGDTINIRKLVLTAGELAVKGKLDYAGSGSPQLNAVLRMNVLDPALLLLPAATAQEAPAEDVDGDLPLALLAALDARLAVHADLARFDTYEASNLDLNFNARNGVIRVEPLTTETYGGRIDIGIRLDVTQPQAVLNVRTVITDIDIPSVLEASGNPQNISGRLRADARVKAVGNSVDAWMTSLTGPVEMVIDDAEVRDLNIERMLCEAVALSNGEALTATFPAVTTFQTLDAKLQFKKGIAELSPFRATLHNIALGGQGQYRLVEGDFDTVFTARLSGDPETQDRACRVSKRIVGIDWPIRCEGRLDGDPAKWCGIDKKGMEKILTQIATKEVQKKVEKEVLKGLDKFFGGSKDKDQ